MIDNLCKFGLQIIDLWSSLSVFFGYFVVFVHMDVDVVFCFVYFCLLCLGGCVYICISALLGCIYLVEVRIWMTCLRRCG